MGGFAGIPVVEHARIKRIQRNAIAKHPYHHPDQPLQLPGFQFQVQVSLE